MLRTSVLGRLYGYWLCSAIFNILRGIYRPFSRAFHNSAIVRFLARPPKIEIYYRNSLTGRAIQAVVAYHVQYALPCDDAVVGRGVVRVEDGGDARDDAVREEWHQQHAGDEGHGDETLVEVVEEDQRRDGDAQPAAAAVGHEQRQHWQRQRAAGEETRRGVFALHGPGDAQRREEHKELRVVVGVVERGVDAAGHAHIELQIGVGRADIHADEALRDGVERGGEHGEVHPFHQPLNALRVGEIRHEDIGHEEGGDEE